MAKRDDILTAAEKLFYEEGMHATGIARVVEQAGTTARTLYHHFDTKEDLVRAVLELRERRYFEMIENTQRLARSFGQPEILSPFHAMKDWLAANAPNGCMFLHALAEFNASNDAIAQFVRDHKVRLRTHLEALVTDHLGHPAPQLVAALMTLLEGATALSAVQSPQSAFETAITTANQLIDLETSR